MAEFIKNFAAYRLDEILGDWMPYNEVVHKALERACKRNGIEFPEEAAWRPRPVFCCLRSE